MPEGLEQLRDIHVPQNLPWWPLAPGVYLLFILAIIAGLVGLYRYYTRHTRRLRQQALQELRRLQRAHDQHQNVSITAAGISVLLKQVALVVYPRAEVAALQGEAWLNFLNTSGKKLPIESIRALLLEAPFCADYQAPIEPLFTVAQAWIKQRSRL
jgi:hypothetical protein